MLRALLLLALALLAVPAQAFPERPIRGVYIAFAAGGLADVIARTLTDRMSLGLGQPFVLENRPGAGGNLAMEAAVRSAPDGHSLVMIGPGAAINPTLYRKLSWSPKDVVPVSLMALGPYAVYTSAAMPVTSVAELVAYAKARPGKLNYASVGIGSGGHLVAVLFALAAGVEMTHVPYKGIQPALPDLVSGEVHLVFNAFGPLNAFVQSGKVKLIGVTSAQRLSHYPDVPTVSEAGVPGFDAGGWYMLFAPAATPRAALERLNREMASAMAHRETFERVDRTGLRPVPQTLEEAAQFFSREIDKWGRAVKASGASAE